MIIRSPCRQLLTFVIRYPVKDSVRKANKQHLRNLPGQLKVYLAADDWTVKDDVVLQRMKESLLAPERLSLKVNCQVMLLKNLDDKLVNGTLGKVTAFYTVAQYSARRNHAPTEDVDAAAKEADKLPLVCFSVFDATKNKHEKCDVLVDRETWSIDGPVIKGQKSAPLLSRKQVKRDFP